MTSLEKISIRLDSHDKFSPSFLFFGAMEKIISRKEEEEKEIEEGAKRKAQTIVIYYNGASVYCSRYFLFPFFIFFFFFCFFFSFPAALLGLLRSTVPDRLVTGLAFSLPLDRNGSRS
jgi:hypothetical protein